MELPIYIYTLHVPEWTCTCVNGQSYVLPVITAGVKVFSCHYQNKNVASALLVNKYCPPGPIVHAVASKYWQACKSLQPRPRESLRLNANQPGSI